ncbi:MAG TPA: alpha/beta fold hydrolase, partial [Acidimicrobiales bacterium]|nr:alpha/beta fold hydrolase [Acidimicrobiales bacterium]
TKPASSAGAMFNDESFSFETLRALGYAAYGGADIGEVTSTASRIPDGDKTAWYSEWRALAERIHADADRSAAEGHAVSARESYLRASNYYRLCEFYLRADSSNDPEVREVGQLSVDSFAHAAQLMNPAPQPVRFAYEDTTLPGWWIPADLGTAHPTGGDPESPRPTLLFHGGFDSTEEELYFSGGAAAARRGYHVLAFAGPGQGSALRDQKLLFRPDWEAVVTPAVDWLLARPDVNPNAIALMGMSFGGLLAPRAAASEHRVAALIAYDGLYSFADAWDRLVGPEVMKLVGDGLVASDSKANALIEEIMNSKTQTFGPALPWGMWVLGADSMAAVLRAVAPYTLEGYAPLITCPTLVLDGENDPGHASQLYDALCCQKTYHLFPAAEGGGEHCQEGVMSRLHQVVFDWLDTVLTTPNAASSIS